MSGKECEAFTVIKMADGDGDKTTKGRGCVR
jgi:hypothetical protein